jgi:hypothetical protein
MDNNTKILIGVGAVCAVLAYMIYTTKNPKVASDNPTKPPSPSPTPSPSKCTGNTVECKDGTCDEFKITLSGINIPCKNRGGIKSTF